MYIHDLSKSNISRDLKNLWILWTIHSQNCLLTEYSIE
uniref:Uncharacterized protein n=1 Tax=uncultured bacterium A1Q1_fos_2140 TaxID=1256565 RepID=L7VS74_9BACT|nr:hypothetical protein [uncultured bacterium A1Q1_fos_2140]